MKKARNQFLYKDPKNGIELWIKRLDELEPKGVGNKIFKLKYNIQKAQQENYESILTFGGAFSNHIAAVAAVVASQNKLKSIGVIRGEELGENPTKTLRQNPTLAQAVQNGMQLEFVSRKLYRDKYNPKFINRLKNKFGEFYLLPEGGTNELAVKGCEEILTEEDKIFDYIISSVGTGGTLSGIINSSNPSQSIIGFTALKADLSSEIENYTQNNNWKLIEETEFGGYAKINKELVSFINRFTEDFEICLDPVYNAKMMYSIFKKIRNAEFKENSRILAIHTGGLQGISGMNQRLKKKNLPIIK